MNAKPMVVDDQRRYGFYTALVYWGLIASGLIVPWGAALINDKGDFRQLIIHMFAPGYNVYLIGAFGLAPMAAFAVFGMLHVGPAISRLDGHIVKRRWFGFVLGAISGVAVSAWGHISIATSRDAQAAIGYIFLPFLVIAAHFGGYLAGRLIHKIKSR